MRDIIKTGLVFGKLTIVREVDPYTIKSGKKYRKFLCKCSCGASSEVTLAHLRSAHTISCGCVHRYNMKAGNNKKHGLKGHALYDVWCNMKKRCYNIKNEKYPLYGARGIIVCSSWLNNFKAFYDFCINNGWRKELQIDREDNDGNYDPDNCRFVTNRDNCLNKRNIQKNNKSGFRGVCIIKKSGKWQAVIQIKGKRVSTGYYATPEEACASRNAYIIEHKLQQDYPIQDIGGGLYETRMG